MEPFKVHILGCGSALPTLRHFPSMQVVECRGKLFMVDCGEGAQLQMRRVGVSFGRMGHIFISHIHGDHCFGLIGMISTFNLLGRTAGLNIFAPKELGPILKQQMQVFCPDLGYEVAFFPVDTTVQQVVFEDRSLTVETIPLDHRLPCCGYLFREKPTKPHIRRDMVDFYGIPVSQLNNIKAGQDYVTPDGDVIDNSRLVLPADPPRSYAYCSDTRYMPKLAARLSGVNTLYHEATYGDDNELLATKYYHSTARQAAKVASDVGVQQLIIGHYSSRYTDENVLLRQALEVFPRTFLAADNKVFDV